MPNCTGCGQSCDFPWCDCDGNATFRRAHHMVKPGDEAQDCGSRACNYCNQLIRKKPTDAVSGSGEHMPMKETQ